MEQEGFKVPETDQELLEFCRKARDAGYIPLSWSNNPGWQSFHQFGMVSNNILGADEMEKMLYGDPNATDWTRPELVDAVKFYFIDMVEAGCFVGDGDEINGLEYNDANTLFYTGKALLNPTGTWMIGGIDENMEEGYEVEMVPFPSLQGGERVLPGGLGSAWFISSSTEHADTAAALLDFLYTPESIQKWVEGPAWVPPLEFDASGFDTSPLLGFAIATAQAGGKGEAGSNLGHYIDIATPDAFNEMMQDGFQAVVAGLKTPEEQLADLQQRWEEGQ
jgi:raffinose/stachyose/melibiose transport system substrate-binding protein